MRVLLWCERFWPVIGGMQLFCAGLVSALQQRGHEFTVVTRLEQPDLPPTVQCEGVPVHRFPFRAALAADSLELLRQTWEQLAGLQRAFAPDLVHICAVGPGVLLYRLTRDAHPAPVLVTMHNVWPNESAGRDTLFGRTLRAADWVTAVSAAALSHIRRLVPETVPRSSLIYNGVALPREPPQPLPAHPPRLLCAGRLEHAKGFDLALTALAAIRPRFPEARLVIAGDGSERFSLEQQAARLGLASLVDFMGWVPQDMVPTLLNQATVVIMPSREESFGLVALEAALMARPVVATRVGGLPEVVLDARTGLLVEPEDGAALAAALARLLDHPGRAVDMGHAARRRAQEIFDWQRCVDAYDALYRKLIKEGTHVEPT